MKDKQKISAETKDAAQARLEENREEKLWLNKLSLPRETKRNFN